MKCISEEAIVYSLTLEVWEQLSENNPKVARFIDLIVVRYLVSIAFCSCVPAPLTLPIGAYITMFGLVYDSLLLSRCRLNVFVM